MRELLGTLLDLVFPPRCRICKNQSAEAICAGCFASLPRIAQSICRRCGRPYLAAAGAASNAIDAATCDECAGKELHFSLARSGGNYAGPLKEAIHQLKYKNGKRLAPYLARFTHECAHEFIDRVDVITFVPLTKHKQAQRGYNQSQLIAEELSVLFSKPIENCLIKHKHTREQNKLGLAERTGNVTGSFVARCDFQGTLLLIDDVYTTGSTVNECARVLKIHGAEEVFVLTVARTPLTRG